MAPSETQQNWRPQWHQRVRLIAKARQALRDRFFRIVRAIANSDDGRTIFAEACASLTNSHSHHRIATLNACDLPYAELGLAPVRRADQPGAGAVFVTARFRSGSTLLWNLFRNVKDVTAYYEPLNERRWFDAQFRGRHTDQTHRFVDDYSREYDGLELLGNYYSESWIRRHLFMGANFWEPQLRNYIEILIERAHGKPILKFNRVDFRLPWLRRSFPKARIIHLYRHPRNQWCSSLLDIRRCPKTMKMKDFAAHDQFYLRMWAKDLKYQFPFLDESTIKYPYQLFYFIWKLSYLFGKQYADHSISYEAILREPRGKIHEVMSAAGIEEYDLAQLLPLIEHSRFEPWRAYADEEWFRTKETECEEVLAAFFETGQSHGESRRHVIETSETVCS